MHIMRRICVTGLLAAVALNAWAAGSAPKSSKEKFDVTGTWQATAQGGRGPATTVTFELKQEGNKLTGTASTNGGPAVEISEARILRTTIYFELAAATPAGPGGFGGPGGPGMRGGGMPGMPGMSMTTRYTGTPSGDEMKFTTQMKMAARDGDAPSGGGRKTEMTATRQK